MAFAPGDMRIVLDFKGNQRRLVAAGLGVAVLLSVVAGPAGAETLTQALSAAYKFNPKLDAARAAQRATDEEVPRALSGYRPSVTGQATTGYQNTNSNVGTANTGTLHPRTYSVGVVQPIFRGFRTVNAVNGAEATVRAGRETLRLSEQSVLLEAVTAFGDVVRDQNIVKLRENNVTVLTRDLKATQDRFNVGEVTRTDVAQAQARRALAVSALDLAKANLQSSRASFERVIGHPPAGLVAPNPTKLVPKSQQEAIEIALRESPTIVAALYREQAARYAIETIRGELLPTVQLESNYGKSFDTAPTATGSISEIEQTTVTGRVTVPFYTGGEVQARVRQAKHTHVQRLQEIEQNRTEQQAQVVQAWSNMVAARAQVESDQASVDANRIALAGVREEERVGQRTLLDVLNAEQELLNSEVNLATDRRNLLVASYSVLAAIGRLNAQELAVSESVYDPEQNYHNTRRKAFDTSITYGDGRREALPPEAPAERRKTK